MQRELGTLLISLYGAVKNGTGRDSRLLFSVVHGQAQHQKRQKGEEEIRTHFQSQIWLLLAICSLAVLASIPTPKRWISMRRIRHSRIIGTPDTGSPTMARVEASS